MKTRNFLTAAMLAAVAAAPFITTNSHTASAQQVVAATCPSGYVLSGSSCVRPAAPTPTCPSGFVFSKGQCIKGRMETASAASAAKQVSNGPWAFVTREAFGVRKAAELDGANFCAVTGSASADAATKFFKDNGLNATHVKVDDDRASMETYQKYDCDVLVVADRVAVSTADSLKPKGDHIVLPEKLEGDEPAKQEAVPAPVVKAAPVQPVAKPVRPAPQPKKPPVTAKKKPAPKKVAKQNVRRKPRCSRIRYAYSRGNTCACAGPRVFTGSACVRPRWF
ncbi:MAG: hypothetical protein MPJ78_19605 [Hyphomicrobiaceae bacterium]|nr:hypothetical protein [Hyphomicrobiaceae bacterium]